MKVGYLLDTHAGPYDGPTPSPEVAAGTVASLLAEAELAEKVGFDSVQVPERHMRSECHFPTPLQLLTAIAARTKRVKLATHSLVLTLYHPMQVAEQAAMIDLMSGGRMILTVAMGYHDDYWRMFGSSRVHRKDRFVEGVEILKLAFSGREFSYDGTYFPLDRVRLTPPPYQAGGPELWLGGHFEKAIERAGRYGDGWCGDPFPIDPKTWWPRIEMYRNAAQEAGNPAKVIILREGWVAPTRKEALQVAAEHHVQEQRYYYRWGIFPPSAAFPSESALTAESLAPHMLLGSPEDCVEQIQRWRDELEVDYVCVRFRMPTGPTFEAARDAIELFGEEVIPKVADAGDR
jgi:alkanesulfonate monooxygenase SsuD/methylene tetrahydromethanopterin reductase-like flavin-dependent oxidoreductase (luciferase family)